MGHYFKLMRLHKPIGIFLLLWPTLWALWIAADGFPPLTILVIFVVGVVVMRSAGCIINDITDRKFDAHVNRTKDRPLANGTVSVRRAMILFFILCIVALGLVLLLNRLTLALALVAILFAIIYPFLKRWTHWPQVGLGIAFSFSIPMAFAAQLNHVPPIAWLLFIAAVLWTIAYDTQYAMVDRKDDLKIGVKSTAILFGQYDRVIIFGLQTVMMFLMIVLGFFLQFNAWFYVGLLAAAALMIYQYFLTRHREPARCFQAFRNNNWVGLVIFVGIVLSYF